jgi:hypothetical protein
VILSYLSKEGGFGFSLCHGTAQYSIVRVLLGLYVTWTPVYLLSLSSIRGIDLGGTFSIVWNID